MDLLTSHPYLASLAGLVLFRSLYAYAKDRSANPRRLPTPPGPKSYPFIGCLLEAPLTKPWLAYDQWFKTYGKYSSRYTRLRHTDASIYRR